MKARLTSVVIYREFGALDKESESEADKVWLFTERLLLCTRRVKTRLTSAVICREVVAWARLEYTSVKMELQCLFCSWSWC